MTPTAPLAGICSNCFAPVHDDRAKPGWLTACPDLDGTAVLLIAPLDNPSAETAT